jgi:secreted PhoX family phosphatase
MKPIDRRMFLAGSAAAALVTGLELPATAAQAPHPAPAALERLDSFNTVVDFRCAPV